MQNWALSIYFDPKGPVEKHWGNVVLALCPAICPVAYSRKTKKKALMLAHGDACSVENCLTGFVGAPHKASFSPKQSLL